MATLPKPKSPFVAVWNGMTALAERLIPVEAAVANERSRIDDLDARLAAVERAITGSRRSE